MAQTVITYKCPNCSGGLEYLPGTDQLGCPFCESKFTEAELQGMKAHQQAEEDQHKQDEFNEHMLEYTCPSCGAEILADENTAADICPYCHNPVAAKGKLSGALRPDTVVPFKYDSKAAKEKFLESMSKKWFLPKDFLAPAHLEQIQGIYYPFWVADADTDCAIDGVATKVRTWRHGDTRYTETSKYSIYRKGDIHFEDLSTAALSEADKAMLEGILPFPATCHEEFSMKYLSGFVTKKRNLEKKAVQDEVKRRIYGYADQILKNTVHGYNNVTVLDRKVYIKHSNWEYCLMPIWILTYNTPKRRYTFAMNGYTGKTYGEMPIDWKKLIIVAGIVGVAVGLLAGFGLPLLGLLLGGAGL
ncbi:MAG: TFIIB-type zinc ribbon-containing protein [Clostridia bacterium]|nr:TFIIB-type zinc ribbon-containing protein [Clostridia bacterium]